MNGKGVGASVLRKEDRRHLHGEGRFTADLRLPRMVEVAFLRSPHAHARIRAIRKPDGAEGRVFTLADMPEVKPMRGIAKLDGFRASDWPVLAGDKVRYAGEAVAMCIGASRAEAEDLAARVEVDYELLPAVVDLIAAQAPDSPIVHEEWGTNVALALKRDDDIEAVAASAPVRISKSFRMARQGAVPMEGKAVLAEWDARREQLVVHASTQIPHITRTGIAVHLGLPQNKVRVIAPDVGGGFGAKCMVQPEEISVAWLARHLRRPARWVEDRRENLICGANAREHHHEVTLYADREGRILGLDARMAIDAGAYSIWPFSSSLEAGMAGGTLPGPYHVPCYRHRSLTIVSNKPPLAPYRSVARASVCFSLELMMDALARELGREPWEIRMANLVGPERMPYRSITNKLFDSGDYPACMKRAVEAVNLPAIRAAQASQDRDGARLGVGFAFYSEQAAHGTSVFAGWGGPMVPGFEQATLKINPDGALEIRTGLQSHGQGMETTLAQIAAQELGIDPDEVAVLHGDTETSPYSAGTYASRSIVMGGGAVATGCRTLAARMTIIAAHLLQTSREQVTLRDGAFHAGLRSLPIREIARVWYLNPEELPEDADRGGLECTAAYRPDPDTGTFTYAAHAAVVSADPGTGEVKVLDYVVVEDCGTVVNPMVVDGQVYGGVVQGIGTALLEEMAYDASGAPSGETLLEYLIPGAVEAPAMRLDRMVTPSPWSEYGLKGMGEGPAIGPPAAIGNAINDAWRDLGVEVDYTPLSPRRLVASVLAAEGGRPAS